MIPVYASLIIPARVAISGDHKRFLERSAKIQFGLLVCVYALSHAPAILDLRLVQWDESAQQYVPWNYNQGSGSAAGLLIYFVLIVQLSEVAQFAWDRLLGKHVIAPSINATKSWEGFLGSVLTTAIIGVLFWFTGVTPFTWYGAALMSIGMAMMGFLGSITMSAIKRRPRCSGLRNLGAGTCGSPRPHRFDMFCRPRILSPDTLLSGGNLTPCGKFVAGRVRGRN